jgi:outer membrane protein assembly factor BamE (lipoprotein component of BamABCDE complex)
VVFSILAGCVLMAALVIVLFFGAAARSGSSREKDQRTVYNRDAFSPLVLGKTEEEVYQIIGKPDSTSEDSESRYWHYRKCTRDPVSKEPDMDVQLVFQDGKVAKINY